MLDGAFLLNGLASNTTYISSIRDETKDTIKEKIGKDEKKKNRHETKCMHFMAPCGCNGRFITNNLGWIWR